MKGSDRSSAVLGQLGFMAATVEGRPDRAIEVAFAADFGFQMGDNHMQIVRVKGTPWERETGNEGAERDLNAGGNSTQPGEKKGLSRSVKAAMGEEVLVGGADL
ncbi:unnamed protein product [Linum trigynum]|uniref:Dirigent protein n=1 Tax=Linum trigynum TaxID=586398 RepID=A0AAV2FNU4_9ROSI